MGLVLLQLGGDLGPALVVVKRGRNVL